MVVCFGETLSQRVYVGEEIIFQVSMYLLIYSATTPAGGGREKQTRDARENVEQGRIMGGATGPPFGL